MHAHEPRALLVVACLILASALVGCNARFPDGKYVCKVVADCPGDEFRSCRNDDESGDLKLCYRTRTRTKNEPTQPEAGRNGVGGESGRGDGTTGTGGVKGEAGSASLGDAGDAMEGAGKGAAADAAGMAGAGAAGTGAAPANVEPDTSFRVLRSEPADGAAQVEPAQPITVFFSEPVLESTTTSRTFAATDDEDNQPISRPIAGTYKADAQRSAVTFAPRDPLRLSTSYTVELTSSIFSETQKSLRPASFHFKVRAGVWHLEPPLLTENLEDAYQDPHIAISAAGQLAISWTASHHPVADRSYTVRAIRRLSNGTWSEAGPIHTSARATQGSIIGSDILALDSGTIVFGAPASGPNLPWTLNCVDLDNTVRPVSVRGIESMIRENILDLATSGFESVYVVQGPPYVGISTDCDANVMPSVWTVPIPSDANVLDVVSWDAGHAVWVQSSSGTEDGSSLWAVMSKDACSAMNLSGCATQISTPAAEQVQSVSRSGSALVWRETQQGVGVVLASVSPYGEQWPTPTQLSSSMSDARSPVVSEFNGHPIAVWVQADANGDRMMSSIFDAGTWSPASPASSLVTGADKAMAPSLAMNARGRGMVMWSQSTADGMGHDLHAVPYVFGVGWLLDNETIITANHTVASQPSLVMDDVGCAHAAWIEANGLWIAHYE
jgi:hypothetical protein